MIFGGVGGREGQGEGGRVVSFAGRNGKRRSSLTHSSNASCVLFLLFLGDWGSRGKGEGEKKERD